jgi:hypothetical protein
MKLDHHWFIEKHVMVLKMYEPPKDEVDAAEFDRTIISYLEQGETVHALVDAREESGSINLRVAAQMKFTRHRHFGYLVLITPNRAAQRMVATMVSRLTPIQLRFANTPEEAIEFLKGVDPSIP